MNICPLWCFNHVSKICPPWGFNHVSKISPITSLPSFFKTPLRESFNLYLFMWGSCKTASTLIVLLPLFFTSSTLKLWRWRKEEVLLILRASMTQVTSNEKCNELVITLNIRLFETFTNVKLVVWNHFFSYVTSFQIRIEYYVLMILYQPQVLYVQLRFYLQSYFGFNSLY